jgi:hypothetical protein
LRTPFWLADLTDVGSRLVEEREQIKDSWEEGGGERGGGGGWGGGAWKIEISAAELNTLATSLAEWEVFMVSSPLNPTSCLKCVAAKMKWQMNPRRGADFPKRNLFPISRGKSSPPPERGGDGETETTTWRAAFDSCARHSTWSGK